MYSDDHAWFPNFHYCIVSYFFDLNFYSFFCYSSINKKKLLKMNFRLIVSVEEDTKTLIGPKIPNINDCITIEDIYKKVILNIYDQREVEVYGRVDAKSK